MSRVSMFLSSLAVLVIAVGLNGCGGASDSSSTEDPTEANGGDEHAGHDHGEDGHAEHMAGAGTEANEALAELSPEDRTAAEKQGTCPVTDAALGSMGKPVKIAVQGRDLFICCEMCRDTVTEDPDKYLAKLNQ